MRALLLTGVLIGGSKKQGKRIAGVSDGPRIGQTALETRFSDSHDTLSRSRRKLLRMILENPEDTYFLSSREMAKRYHVDAAAIVRTIQALGYQKFEGKTVTERIRHRLDLDLRNLQALQTTIDPKKIDALSRKVKYHRQRNNSLCPRV
jgi:hypothetical protein